MLTSKDRHIQENTAHAWLYSLMEHANKYVDNSRVFRLLQLHWKTARLVKPWLKTASWLSENKYLKHADVLRDVFIGVKMQPETIVRATLWFGTKKQREQILVKIANSKPDKKFDDNVLNDFEFLLNILWSDEVQDGSSLAASIATALLTAKHGLIDNADLPRESEIANEKKKKARMWLRVGRFLDNSAMSKDAKSAIRAYREILAKEPLSAPVFKYLFEGLLDPNGLEGKWGHHNENCYSYLRWWLPAQANYLVTAEQLGVSVVDACATLAMQKIANPQIILPESILSLE